MSLFIDFNYVKENADIEAILAHYELNTSGSGSERRCCCPFHDDENPSFSINVDDGKFNCHAASCGEKGNILDFVAAMEETEDLRKASQTISEICGIDLAPPRSAKSKRGSKKKAVNGNASGAKRKPIQKAEKAAVDDDKPKTKVKPNSPLDFKLNLDPAHEYGAGRGLSKADIERFEMGLCTRGTMKDRWCIPYHNAGGDLIGYIGRHIADPVPGDETKYKLPKGFHKNQELFNLHRITGHAQHVSLVEGAFDAIRLHGLAMPAVALIGTTISDEQISLLVNAGFKSVTVILDNDAPDQKTQKLIEKAESEIISRLSRALLVRSVVLPEETDPATAPAEFLSGRVPVFPN